MIGVAACIPILLKAIKFLVTATTPRTLPCTPPAHHHVAAYKTTHTPSIHSKILHALSLRITQVLERSLNPSGPFKAPLDPNAILSNLQSIQHEVDRGVLLPMGSGVPEAIDDAIDVICEVELREHDEEIDVVGHVCKLFGLVERVESGAEMHWHNMQLLVGSM